MLATISLRMGGPRQERSLFLFSICYFSFILVDPAPSWRILGSIWEDLGLRFEVSGAHTFTILELFRDFFQQG